LLSKYTRELAVLDLLFFNFAALSFGIIVGMLVINDGFVTGSSASDTANISNQG
jgi:hypothetical protein